MKDFLSAFLLIFVAEMGDKTQIMAMAFATRFKVRYILAGVAIGSFLNHGLAIVFGSVFLRFFPLNALQLIAGVLFLSFGLISLNISEEKDEDDVRYQYGAIFTVALAFFLGELGDKTQLTALTLGAQADIPMGTLFGTVTGMVCVSLLGILVGSKLGGRIPEPMLKVAAFSIFMIFGLIKIFTSEYVLSMGDLFQWLLIGVIAMLTLYRVIIFTRQLREISRSALKEQANALMLFKEGLQKDMNALCHSCKSCRETVCLVGYMKTILVDKESAKHVDSHLFDHLELKRFDPHKAKEILNVIDAYDRKYPSDAMNNLEVKRVKSLLLDIVKNHQEERVNIGG